jgi:Amt family ammonium transporter
MAGTSVTVPAAEWQAFKAKMAEYDMILKSTPAPTVSNFDSGDTAWMLTSSALVLLMSLPGLALYYGGQSQAKNVLSTVAQTFSLACLITILWLMMGYSLCFSKGSPVYGDASRFWLIGTMDAGNQTSPYRISTSAAHELAGSIPESVFCIYQV